MDGGAGDVGAVMSTDIGVDNVANNNVTKVTNNLGSKDFSRISVLEDQTLHLKILFQKKMLNVFLLQLSWSSWKKI